MVGKRLKRLVTIGHNIFTRKFKVQKKLEDMGFKVVKVPKSK